MSEAKRNYQLELEKLIRQQEMNGERPALLLHSCCAPCSSYVLEYLLPYFDTTVFYYNPNIAPEEEFRRRALEQKRFLEEFCPEDARPALLVPEYDPGEYFGVIKGLEKEPEGGSRCGVCFRLRLERTAKEATARGFAFFGTTLTVSPHKNAQVLNAIGKELAGVYGVRWLPSDFKKKEGYKRSIQLSIEYGLYRQDFCGCAFSKRG